MKSALYKERSSCLLIIDSEVNAVVGVFKFKLLKILSPKYNLTLSYLPACKLTTHALLRDDILKILHSMKEI